jgi:hypothetical protein
LLKEGLTCYGDLVREREYANNRDRVKRLEMVLNCFPKHFNEIANCFDEDMNYPNSDLKKILNVNKIWIPAEQVTTKELQVLLKISFDKITENDFENRLGITYDTENLKRFRVQCKNAKLRNIYYRMVNKDFFTYERMKKFKMSENDKCPRCDNVETTKHLLWECSESENIWKIYNNMLTQIKLNNLIVRKYDDLYNMSGNGAINMIKIKIIQEMIQINRPTRWVVTNVKNIASELKNMELYIAIKNGNVSGHDSKWKCIETFLKT